MRLNLALGGGHEIETASAVCSLGKTAKAVENSAFGDRINRSREIISAASRRAAQL
jgi:hypothetical protein